MHSQSLHDAGFGNAPDRRKSDTKLETLNSMQDASALKDLFPEHIRLRYSTVTLNFEL